MKLCLLGITELNACIRPILQISSHISKLLQEFETRCAFVTNMVATYMRDTYNGWEATLAPLTKERNCSQFMLKKNKLIF